jgi:ATP-dependent Clp protease ATP-binding subunit ClpB
LRAARGTGQPRAAVAELTTRWQNERDKIAAEGKIKEQLDRARIELEQAQRRAISPRPASCPMAASPNWSAAGRGRGQAENAMLREEVTEDDIAAWSAAGPASRSTG